MKKIVCLLLVCMLFMGMLSACKETISVTEEQKSYAEAIYQRASSKQTTTATGFSDKLYLLWIYLVENNGDNYIEFLYSQNSVASENGRLPTGGKVYSYGGGASKYYKIINGKIAASPTDNISSVFSSRKAMVEWDSSLSATEMTEKLYKIAQYL